MARDSRYPVSVKAGKPVLSCCPRGWDQATLGRYLELAPRKAKLDDNENYDLVTVKRSRGGVVRRERLQGRDIAVKSQFFINQGDFLISKRQIIHGACGIVPKELDGSIVSNEYFVFRGKDNFWLPFMRYLSESLYFQQTCFHSSIGVHVEKMIFKIDTWLKWKFNIPPLKEQRKIAKILYTWDNAIAIREQRLANSQQQKKALMQQLLTGKKRLPGFKGGWRTAKVGEICELGTGQGAPQGEKYFKEGRHDFLRVSDIGSSVRRYAPPARDRINDLAVKEKKLKKVPAGATLFTKSGASLLLNQRAQLNRDAYVVSHLGFAKANDRTDEDFVFYLFLMIDFSKIAAGTSLPALQLSALKKVLVSVPEKSEQKAIARVLSRAGEEVEMLGNEVVLLQLEKKALMQQLLTGKRRVKLDEAEQATT